MAAIVRNPFRFRHRARSVVVAESSNSYERRRPHPAIISRRSTVSVPPFSTTTAKSLTRSSTDQVRPLDRKLVLFFSSFNLCVIYFDVQFAVRDSPPTRKASLDRILSPQISRRSPPYTSSPHQTGGLSVPVRDKSLSPVVAVPLSTSMSNASIHSGHSAYSEDSLTAGNQRYNHQSCQQCVVASDFTNATPVVHRWNNINYDSHSGKNIPTDDCWS